MNLDHNSYSKISDFVFYFTSEWHMRFYVELNKYDDKGKHNYHREFGYNTKNGFEISIKRDFNYYLAIESAKKDSNGFRPSIRIFQEDMYFLLFKLNNAEQWFIDKSKDIFAKKGNSIIIPSKQYYEIIKLRYNQSIQIEPTVMTFNGNDVIGVRFYLNNESLNFGITAERFLGFLYFIRNFNMFQSAQLMINYLGMQYGTNYSQFENNIQQDNYENNRFLNNNYIEQKPRQSFFELAGATERSE